MTTMKADKFKKAAPKFYASCVEMLRGREPNAFEYNADAGGTVHAFVPGPHGVECIPVGSVHEFPPMHMEDAPKV